MGLDISIDSDSALAPLVQALLNKPDLMGISHQEYSGMATEQKNLFLEGEALYYISRQIGILSSQKLFASQWGFATPEWYDHRHSWLDPDKWNHDYVDSSVYNVLPRLPLGGTLLSLCCGDGFFEKHYYSKRCSSIVAVDRDSAALCYAKRLHSTDSIKYIYSDIFDLSLPEASFDVIVMRSAIEHFSEDQQNKLFLLIKNLLKPGGWFVGDTPANPSSDPSHKLLEHHEHEWSSEFEMNVELSRSFGEVITSSLVSNEPTANALRTTLFWACRDPIIHSF